ncbi:MAG: hypothetical protein IIB19_06330 [Chloroflexi bacterium]|nr:hypothetical protein [Chloroflexota bacterium]MCH8066408.1 hypothetical protein [Chloroflexota bacterium]
MHYRRLQVLDVAARGDEEVIDVRVAADDERIALLKASIPALRRNAIANREHAETLAPIQFLPARVTEDNKAQLRGLAERDEREAVAMEQELVALGVEPEIDD